MVKYGGGFVRSLAEAAMRADSDNLRRIKEAWPEYWERYSIMSNVASEQNTPVSQPGNDSENLSGRGTGLAGMDCSRILIDCPRCGAKPPIAHDLGGGPRFAGVRTCGNGCGTWDDDDRQNWGYIHSQNAKVTDDSPK